MDSDVKWFMIMIMIVVVGMCAAGGLSDYSRHQCKIALAQSNRTVDDIEKICK
jgi:hypothetical protein